MEEQAQKPAEQTAIPEAPATKPKFWHKKWIKGMGLGAFLFFFIKGLVWLAIFFGAFKVVGC